MRLLLFLCLLTLPAAAQTPNLLHNGDFEQPGEAIPPGWVMWGDEKWKDPANYTRDMTNPHSGQASLRIHHPANSTGYIVSSLQDNPIQPQKGKTYTISFWAKTDHPGPASFQVQGFSSLQPLAGYSAPLSQPFETGATWQPFSFHITESVDFFAEDARFLMLAFRAASNAAEEKTLWIDDVAVRETPSPPDAPALLNPATIAYAPLAHRLTPGPTLNITIDAARKLRRVSREVGAVSFHRLAGYMGLPYDQTGAYKMTPEQEDAIKAMRLPHTRFYGVGDEPFALESALGKAAAVLHRTGIPAEGTVLELEDQGAMHRLEPDIWARGASYAQKQKYGFHFWEVANEPWIHRAGATPAYPTPQDYVKHVIEVDTAIKRVQPGSRIGIGIDPRNTSWGNLVLKTAAGHYDFVAGHWYSFIDVSHHPVEEVVAGENYRVLDQMLRLNALLHAYNPGRDVYQYDTEWSLHSMAAGGAGSTVQNGNIVGALHRAVRLIYLLREDIVRGASAWEMFANAQGSWNALALIPSKGEARSMLYWTHRSFNEHTGEWVLDINGTTPWYQPQAKQDTGLPGPLVPAVAMLSGDGKTMFLIVANASWDKSVPFTIHTRNFPIGSPDGIVLSQSDQNAAPLVAKREDVISPLTIKQDGAILSGVLPPHCIAFVTVRKG